MPLNQRIDSFAAIQALNANQQDSPNTQHILYQKHSHQLELVHNVYKGVDTTKEYLFKFPQEIKETYDARMERATLRNFVRRAVEAFTGMIFRKPIEIENYGARVTRLFDTIDTRQNIRQFSKNVTTAAARDGKTYILIDSPSDGLGEPYMVHVLRQQLINWRRDTRGKFTMIVLEEVIAVPNGTFGTRYIEQWRHYNEVGDVSLFRRNEASSEIEQIGETVSTDYPGIPFIEIPIDDIPMLYDTAKLNIKHFNRLSHKDRYLTMAALPIPVIWGADIDDEGVPNVAKPALVIGVDEAFVFTGTKQEADFEWRELSGTSVDLLEKDLDSITEDITTGILRAADSANSVQKTATEVALLQAEASDRVSAIAIAVESGMQEALIVLSSFCNEAVPENAIFLLSKDFNAALAGTEGSRIVLEAYLQGIVSIDTLLQSFSDAELISFESTKKELGMIAADTFKPVPKITPPAAKESAPAIKSDNRTKAVTG